MKLPKKIPNKFKSYFWDTHFDSLDGQKSYKYIIQRLLDKGNIETARFVWKHYPHEKIKEVLEKQRDFSPWIGNFWRLMLDIPKEKVACLNPHYLAMRKTVWPF